jgi:hypothetical protein
LFLDLHGTAIREHLGHLAFGAIGFCFSSCSLFWVGTYFQSMAERDPYGERGDPHAAGAPDPSLATNERLADAEKRLRIEISQLRTEVKGWVETLQLLLEQTIKGEKELTASRFSGYCKSLDVAIASLEEKIHGAEDKTASLDRVVQTRLAGSETALNAAMAAADKVTQKIEIGVGSVMAEMKQGFSKQIDSINEKIDDLKKRMFESGGRSEGQGHLVGWIFAAIAAFAAIGMFIVVFSREPAHTAPTSLRSSVTGNEKCPGRLQSV